jgi:hypothetical protein
MSNKVVARFRDGRVIKGISLDVDPAKPVFHLRPAQGAAMEIKLTDLKALFFVRSLEGNPTHKEARALAPGDARSRGSTLVTLRFADGEAIIGLTIRFPPNKPYFFVVPVDTKSNNIRILINRDAVTSMEAAAGG